MSMVERLLLSTYEVTGSILSVHAPKTCIPSMVIVERSVLMLLSRGSHAYAPRLMKLILSDEAKNSSTETAIFISVSIFRLAMAVTVTSSSLLVLSLCTCICWACTFIPKERTKKEMLIFFIILEQNIDM